MWNPSQGNARVPNDHPLSPGGSTLSILDANALLPPRLSDILFDLHAVGLYSPRWTETIEREFIKNFGPIVFGRNKAERRKIAQAPPDPKHVAAATHRLSCFRSAAGVEHEVLRYEEGEFTSKVPKQVHSGDIHVVSAALVVKHYADQLDKAYIVSNNLVHLAVSEVGKLGVTVISPGAFIDKLQSVAPMRVEVALMKSISDLQAPQMTQAGLLAVLSIHGASKTALHYSAKWSVAIPRREPLVSR